MIHAVPHKSHSRGSVRKSPRGGISCELAARIATSGAIATRRAALRLRWWWSGVGIAATLAGAAAGTAAVAMNVPIDLGHRVGAAADPGAINGSTSFGDIAGSDR
ncbi:hypothetical protein [Sphingomonas albertensis]|uniref:Uncharacterized protein n=1 Tax=Sphingomonas albertensis TaxID=2762591 RepID=A0ABR7AM74_9SPHN|nr:hypothetical protein [Sphingomonas albertensis]MBC3941533.1 hypothetical protein [Sphingomonas albertensis]